MGVIAPMRAPRHRRSARPSLHPMVGGVGAVEPAHDLGGHRMVDRRVALPQPRALVAQAFQSHVLEVGQIGLEHGREIGARQRPRGVPERGHVAVGLALAVARDQRRRRDQAQLRLQRRIDRMRRDARADRGRAPGEAAQVQETRHPRPVVDGVVVPQRRLAAQGLGHAREVTGAELAGADLLAGPVHADPRIEAAPEFLEVARRALAEDDIEHPVVGVVGRTHHDAAGAGDRRRGMDDPGLPGREVAHVAAGVVEQDREVVQADRVQRPDLGAEIRHRRRRRVAVQLVRAQAHAEAHPEAAAMRRQLGQLGERTVRMRLAPAPPQEGVGLGCVMEPGEADGAQLRQHLAALIVAPRTTEIAFDDTQFRNHACDLCARVDHARGGRRRDSRAPTRSARRSGRRPIAAASIPAAGRAVPAPGSPAQSAAQDCAGPGCAPSRSALMNVVFLSPHFPPNFFPFCVALRAAGATVLGIADEAYDRLRPELRSALTEYYRVDGMASYDGLLRGLGHFIARHGRIDRLDSLSEHWLPAEARLREDFNIPGLRPDDLGRARRKSRMKEVFAANGIACARGTLCRDGESVRAFVRDARFRVVAKNDVGVGAAGTCKLANDADVDRFVAQGLNGEYLLEAFVDGTIVTYDGLVNRDGQVVFEASLRYSRGVMEAVNEGTDIWYWTERRIAADLRDAGRTLVRAFSLRERFFHFEFFRLRDARLVALEVNLRPPGGLTVDMWNYQNDADIFRAWAQLLTTGGCEIAQQRAWFCAYVGRKRRIAYAHGHDAVVGRLGSLVVHQTAMDDVFSAAIGDYGYLLRSPDLDVLAAAAGFIQQRA